MMQFSFLLRSSCNELLISGIPLLSTCDDTTRAETSPTRPKKWKDKPHFSDAITEDKDFNIFITLNQDKNKEVFRSHVFLFTVSTQSEKNQLLIHTMK